MSGPIILIHKLLLRAILSDRVLNAGRQGTHRAAIGGVLTRPLGRLYDSSAVVLVGLADADSGLAAAVQ